MSEAQLRKDLLKHFQDIQEDEKLLLECVNICRNYNLTAEDLFYRWEALRYTSHHGAGSSVWIFAFKDAVTLRESIEKELHKQAMQIKRLKETKPRVDTIVRPKGNTGLRLSKSAAIKTEDGPGGVSKRFKVSFKGCDDSASHKARNYRYMFERVVERSEVLDERIDEFKELVRDHYDIEEPGDPSAITEEEIVVVGRICSDADSTSSNSKLTDGSIFLESSRMMGSGARVPLRFDANLKLRGIPSGSGGVGLFPGAIVALKGKNGGGGWFAVSEILSLPPLPPSPSASGASNSYGATPGAHGDFDMAVACGPYTHDGDLEYRPLALMMAKAMQLRPAVLLLMGPFVDASHAQIKTGDMDQTPQQIFARHFMESIQTFVTTAPGSLVLLVPSVRDIISDHAVFPQAELQNATIADPRVKMLPNPCRFSINNTSFAATSADVLFHLRSQELVQRGKEVDLRPCHDAAANDTLANTCRHLLQQRSFYPLFPSPADLSHEVNLDISHSELLRIDTVEQPYAPDILLLPSRLKQFSKNVDATVVVNPSFLTKGTFANIRVGDQPGASIGERISCDISKL